MKIPLAVLAAVLISAVLAENDSWSWNKKEKDTAIVAGRRSDQGNKTEEIITTDNESQGRHLYSDQEIYSNTNDTTLDEIIEQILHRSREGRQLDEYSEICTDPNVQEALEKGDDVQARNLIKEKLCSLGLMQCDSIDIEGKRPFRSPNGGIYAQGPLRPPYGPPRPMPPHRPSFNMGPPRKVGYEGPILSKPFINGPSGPHYNGPPGPVYNGPYLDTPPSSHLMSGPGATFSKPPPGAIIYGSKPPGPVFEGVDAPYDFEHVVGDKIHVEHSQSSFDQQHHQLSHNGGFPGKPTIVVNAQGGAAGASGGATTSASALQQHVHHHFHHLDAANGKVPVVPLSPVPLPTGNGINSDFAAIASSTGGFAPLSPGYDFKKDASQASSFTSGFNGAAGVSQASFSSGFNGPVGVPQSSFTSGFNGAGGLSGISGLSQGGLISGNAIHGLGGVNGGVRPVSSLYETVKPVSETGLGTYGSGFTNGYGSDTGASFGNTGFGASSSGVYNGNTASFHTLNPDYYKKELNGGNQFNSVSGYGQQNKLTSQLQQQQQQQQYGGQFSQYNGVEDYSAFETARQHNIDCVCVPYNQCPAADRIGRKDDLILPIDPRNLGSDIEALADDTKNSTSNVDSKTAEDIDATEIKKVAKREIAEKKISEEGEENASDVEPRLTVSNNIPQTTVNFQRKKVLPTFGVSFGLPQPSGAYPFNSYGHGYPAQNPYFGSISPNGLNLGLVNINPLVSLQWTKNEHGEKLVKPLVNLHVTPNEQIIHKVGSLFQAKKEFILNQHEHFHQHSHYRPSPPEVYFPHPPPHIHHGPPEFYPPEHIHHGPPVHEFHHPPGHFHHGPSDLEFHPPPNHIHHRPPIIHDFHPPTNIGGSYGFGHPPPFFHEPSGPPSGVGFDHTPYDFSPNGLYERSYNVSNLDRGYANSFHYNRNHRQEKKIRFDGPSDVLHSIPTQVPGKEPGGRHVTFPNSRRKRSLQENEQVEQEQIGSKSNESRREQRQAYYGGRPQQQQCSPSLVCCRRPHRPQQQQQQQQFGRCGTRNAHGITGRIKNPVYVDGDSEFGEYPWQAAVLKKDPKESVYVCGGTIIDQLHIITAAHCVKTFGGFDLRVRLGEWDVNHDVEFFPYIERDIVSVHVHPEYYAGTLDNDLAVLKLDQPIDFIKNPHISPACLPDKYSDFTGARCWTTGWGKDAFGDYGKYQNILKEVDVPIISQQQCQNQLRHTRLGYNFNLHPGFLCAGGEEGKDACKGDGGGPMVCERNGIWHVVGVVSWGIGCGQVNVPGVYVRVSHYLDWINQITRNY